MKQRNLEGFLFINKPANITSFSCVHKIKTLLPPKTKVGHAGVLDAFATGLLIIGISRNATKHLNSILKLDKWYIAQGKFGELTDTLDKTGTILQEEAVPHITKQDIERVLHSFGTEYQQTPPIYSALKYKGRSLSELARTKKISPDQLEQIVKYKTKKVNLYHLELIKFDFPMIKIKTHVSPGTYIRSLMNDIASQLGTIVTTHELERTQIGLFSLNNAVEFSNVQTIEDVQKHLVSIEEVIEQIEGYMLL